MEKNCLDCCQLKTALAIPFTGPNEVRSFEAVLSLSFRARKPVDWMPGRKTRMSCFRDRTRSIAMKCLQLNYRRKHPIGSPARRKRLEGRVTRASAGTATRLGPMTTRTGGGTAHYVRPKYNAQFAVYRM